MLTLQVTVTADCEGLLHSLPRHEWELESEEYNDDGTGVVTITAHDLDDTTSALEWALNMHPGVVSYRVV